MARHHEREQPVSEEEFEEMPEKISDHFDRIRTELEESLDEQTQ
jgi:hypothetical protein